MLKSIATESDYTVDQLRRALAHARAARKLLHECRAELEAAAEIAGDDFQIADTLHEVGGEVEIGFAVSHLERELLSRGESIEPAKFAGFSPN